MPTEAPEVNLPSKSDVAKEEAKLKRAKERKAGLIKVVTMQRTSTMEIGWRGREMKQDNDFARLGVEENEFREQVGIERATWFRAIQIAEGLKNLSKKRFLTLFAGKAYQLLRLSEKDRYKDAWLDRAADPKLTEAVLTEMIDSKLDSGEVKADATSVEERGWLKIRMYKAALEVVKQKLENFCKEHGLGDDYGEALSVIMSDEADDKLTAPEIEMLRKVRTELQVRMPELKMTVELLKDAKRPHCECCKTFATSATGFIEGLAKAAVLKGKGARVQVLDFT